MPRALSDAKLRSAKPREKPYKLADGEGLFLLVKPNGSRLWRLRYWLGGREQLYSVGQYPAMALGDARKAADAARELVRQGLSPTHARQDERARNLEAVLERRREQEGSFARVAEAWFAAGTWAQSTRDAKRGRLDQNLLPKLGGLPIAKVGTREVRELLVGLPKWTAVYAKTDLNQIFRFALVRDLTESNPIPGLAGLIRQPRSTHKAALSRDQVVEFFARLRAHRGYPETLAAFRLLLATVARPGEVVSAEWSEVDLAARLWRIPPEKMKARRAHVVPLVDEVVPVLEHLRAITGRGRWLFPDRAGRTHSNTTRLSVVMKGWALAPNATPHGWRTTFSTWANEAGYRPDAIELQLAHEERNKVRSAYNHALLLDERRKMMQAWAGYLAECEVSSRKAGT